MGVNEATTEGRASTRLGVAALGDASDRSGVCCLRELFLKWSKQTKRGVPRRCILAKCGAFHSEGKGPCARQSECAECFECRCKEKSRFLVTVEVTGPVQGA